MNHIIKITDEHEIYNDFKDTNQYTYIRIPADYIKKLVSGYKTDELLEILEDMILSKTYLEVEKGKNYISCGNIVIDDFLALICPEKVYARRQSLLTQYYQEKHEEEEESEDLPV